jgi:hypothetical protein
MNYAGAFIPLSYKAKLAATEARCGSGNIAPTAEDPPSKNNLARWCLTEEDPPSKNNLARRCLGSWRDTNAIAPTARRSILKKQLFSYSVGRCFRFRATPPARTPFANLGVHARIRQVKSVTLPEVPHYTSAQGARVLLQ